MCLVCLLATCTNASVLSAPKKKCMDFSKCQSEPAPETELHLSKSYQVFRDEVLQRHGSENNPWRRVWPALKNLRQLQHSPWLQHWIFPIHVLFWQMNCCRLQKSSTRNLLCSSLWVGVCLPALSMLTNPGALCFQSCATWLGLRHDPSVWGSQGHTRG